MQRQHKQQIPFWDDNKNGNSNCKSNCNGKRKCRSFDSAARKVREQLRSG